MCRINGALARLSGTEEERKMIGFVFLYALGGALLALLLLAFFKDRGCRQVRLGQITSMAVLWPVTLIVLIVLGLLTGFSAVLKELS